MIKYEIEKKFRIDRPKEIVGMLNKMGARLKRGGTEINLFLDTEGQLHQRELGLRLREFCSEGLLTVKGPKDETEDFTKRMEVQTHVNFHAARAMLEMMGFHIYAQYKKKRDEYAYGRSIITVDYVPDLRGWYLEIEGEPASILRISSRLKLPKENRERRSYFRLIFGPKGKLLRRFFGL
jgi:predicted adenylyl cyclase CyaB